MIPSDVIPLSAIPLTKHGKVDRARLPALTASEILPLETTVRSAQEIRLAAIWADLLGRKHVGLDDNFFDLGGHSLLVAVLQQRIATKFGQCIPIAELFHSPTVRQQAQLTERLVKGDTLLPPGVLALQPHGARNPIFWVHHLMGDLAKAIGDDQPFFSVVPTPMDFALLGEAPTLQTIAACQVRKILATKSEGPYTIGGFCAGAVLAYEVASQLQVAGHEISLLVMVDSRNLSYLESCDSLRRKLSYLRYALKRAKRLGPRISLAYLRYDLLLRYAPSLVRFDRTEMRVAQDRIEAAARAYRPKKYEGKVLLVLASEHAPHRNFLPGWQAVVPHGLHTRYVDAHHRDLLDAQKVRDIADTITAFIATTGDESLASGVIIPDQWALVSTAMSPRISVLMKE
jgi:thioesterase domain-containing protein